MSQSVLRCGILGAQETDLTILSDLHRRADVEVVFVYDSAPHAVGLEIGEIIGVSAYSEVRQLDSVKQLDLLVVSEPRERFSREIEMLAAAGPEVISASAAMKQYGARVTAPESVVSGRVDEYSVEDTLVALERLLDRAELLKFLLDVAVKATGSTAGSVMLYSRETEELYIGYATGLSERVVKRTRQKVGEGIAGTVASQKEPQLVRLPAEMALYAHDRERVDIGSAISVPLVWEGRLLGVLNVSSGRREREHDERDLERLKTLSRRLSRVLAESQKLEALQLRHREAKVRSTLGEIAAREVSTQEKFSILARYLGDLVGADTVDIFVNTREGDWFVLGGSNRLVSGTPEKFRYQRGALSRAFLEKRCIVMTEGASNEEDDPFKPLSSAVYCHLPLTDLGGVVGFEFGERYRLDEFLLIREAVVAELTRFVSYELRDRRLRRQLRARERVSGSAASILRCRTAEELAIVLSRLLSDVLESERVSVRLRESLDAEGYQSAYVEPPSERGGPWRTDDEQRFDRLSEKQEPFSLAFLNFDAELRDDGRGYTTLLGYPVVDEQGFWGGFVAYDKRPEDPLEDAVYSETDQEIVGQIAEVALAALGAIRSRVATGEGKPESAASYENIVEENRERFLGVCDSEISRSDRYHHSFAVILFRIVGMEELIERDRASAFTLIDEITQGVQTRTRKTDYGTWIDGSTYAMLSLEGSKRMRFLISRVILYLAKDLAGAGLGRESIQVGSTPYPGTARTGEELLEEAVAALAPPQD